MTDFVYSWNKDSILTKPCAPLGLVAMPGCEKLGEEVNNWLLKWKEQQEVGNSDSCDPALVAIPGYERDNFLIDVDCPRFGSGEAKGMIKSTVRGYDLFIISDVGAYNVTYNMYGQKVPMSPDDHYQDLKRIIAAAGGKPKRISVIMPMLYEGRQHRRSSRESLDCAIALQELNNINVSNIITFDAHDPRVQNAIPYSGFESIMPSYQILKALFREVKDLKLDKEHTMIVSPDEGAMDRNIFYSESLGLDLGMFYKRRDYTKIHEGRNPIIAHEYLGSSVEGKDVFVCDDIISSGESVLDLARELKKNKAKRIFAAGTFALFTNGIEEFNKAYEEGIITKVISTNLTYRKPELKKAPWFVEANMGKYIAYLIASINHDRSLSSLLNPYDRISKLLTKYQAGQTK